MITLVWICLGLLAVLAAVQWLPVWAFAHMLRRGPAGTPGASYCPKTAVVLCLRGADPFLRECVRRLLDQEYPHYELVIIVDSREDPAWQVVHEVLQERRPAVPVRVQPLEQPHDTCALKCSALVQAVSSLDESFQVVALLDADTLPHRTWLRELVAPLGDRSVGVASGNRWYMPHRTNLGSLVRYVWNAAAVVQMYWNRFTWGGSVALRSEVFRCPELLDRWRRSVSSDTVIYNVVRRLGLRTAFVPTLLMVNRESCSLGQFYRWVTRQLVVGRLYHPGWPAVLAHGLGTTVVLLAAVALVPYAAWKGHGYSAGALAVGLLGYLLAMLAALAVLEYSVQRVVHLRGESCGWITPGVLASALFVLPLTQLAYAAALVAAMRLRKVAWRGVQYEIAADGRIHMVEYRPFQADVATDFENHSL